MLEKADTHLANYTVSQTTQVLNINTAGIRRVKISSENLESPSPVKFYIERPSIPIHTPQPFGHIVESVSLNTSGINLKIFFKNSLH